MIEKTLTQKQLVSFIKKVAKSNTIPIIDNHFLVKDGKMIFTNLDNTVIFPTDLEDGIYITIGNDFVKVDEGVDDFPSVPEIEKNLLRVDISELKSFFKQALSFSGKDELRPVLTGIHLFSDGDKVIIEATDAYIAFRKALEIKTEPFDIILNPGQVLFSLYNKSNNNLFLEIEKTDTTNSILSNGEYEVIGRNIDGKYPMVKNAFSIEQKQSWIVDKKVFQAAIKEVEPYSHQGTKALSIFPDYENNKLIISAEDIDRKVEKSVSVATTFNDNPFSVDLDETTLIMPILFANEALYGLNSKLLTTVLNNIDSVDVVIGVTARNRALTIERTNK